MNFDFFKLSYPPFLFECWFYDKIKDEKGVAVVNNGIISLQFLKFSEKTWPTLFHPEFGKEIFPNDIQNVFIF